MMKTAAGMLMIIAVAACAARGQSAEEMIARGNSAYQQGRFAEARDIYLAMVNEGITGGALFYNLGNALYKTGDVPRAILMYERAAKFTPNDEDLLHNLEVANLSIADRVEPTPRLFLWDIWDDVRSAFSMNAITWIVYCAYALLAIIVCAFVLASTYRARKALLLAGSGVLLVLLAGGVIFAGRLAQLRDSDSAIVLDQVVSVKNSPEEKSTDAFVLHAGVKVRIAERLGDWYQIRLADGKTGWLPRGSVEAI